jgi:regulator of protease activity HflC (stomatin/prohibitin superfamily)
MEFIIQFFTFIKDLWGDLIFWFVVPQTQKAVVLRNGKFLRTAGPGAHFKLPCIFALGDEVNYADAVTETTETQPQSLTTADGKSVVVSAIIKHHVTDPKVYILEVMDVKDAIVDITMGKIKKNVMDRTWEECKCPSLDNDIAKQARSEAKKWGVHIDEVTIVNLAEIRSIRLIGHTMSV